MTLIRAATAEDLPFMRFAAEPVNVPVSQAYFAEWLGRASALVAIGDIGRVIGQIFYVITGEDQQRVVYFFLLHVDLAERGVGVGSMLVREVERVGREAGCCGATLGVDHENYSAITLYARHGYVAFGERSYDVPSDPPIQRKEILMVRYFAPPALTSIVAEFVHGEPSCPSCAGSGYVCEDHPDRPWRYGDCCGAAGQPCGNRRRIA